MKICKMPILVFMFVSMFLYSNGHAYTIKEGTVSVFGSSLGSLGYSNTEYPNGGYHSQDYSFSAGSGYFIKNNLELGVLLSIYNYSYGGSSQQESTYTAIQPYFTIHTPITEQTSIFYGISIGYGQNRMSYTSSYSGGEYTNIYKSKSTMVSARLGWEYFFSDWSAFQIALNAMHSDDKDISPSSDIKSKQDRIDARFGFSLYFQ